MILHITTKKQWDSAKSNGFYHDAALDAEGFIHCSKPQQIMASAAKHFHGQSGLVLLCIVPDKVTAPIKYEDSYGTGEEFPHIYGILNTDAVVEVAHFPVNKDGTFSLPDVLDDPP